MKGGIIVEWENAEGKQKGFAYSADQKPEFSRTQKVFTKCVNTDFSPKMQDGKQVISLRNRTELKIIGYID